MTNLMYNIVTWAEFHFFLHHHHHLHGSTYSLTRQNLQVDFGTNELHLIQGSAHWVSICPSLLFWKVQFSLHLVHYFPGAILFSKTDSQKRALGFTSANFMLKIKFKMSLINYNVLSYIDVGWYPTGSHHTMHIDACSCMYCDTYKSIIIMHMSFLTKLTCKIVLCCHDDYRNRIYNSSYIEVFFVL